MYKATSDKHNHMLRTGSHSTKPVLVHSGNRDYIDEYKNIQSLSLFEAQDLRERIVNRKQYIELEISSLDPSEKSKRYEFAKEMLRLNTTLTPLNRHVKNLRCIAAQARESDLWRRAVDEVLQPNLAIKVLQRKIDIQNEFEQVLGKLK